MPLLDHFAEPQPIFRKWEALHSFLSVTIGGHLNAVLPPRFFAAVQIHPSVRIEADVAEFDHGPEPEANGHAGGGGTAVATAPRLAAPPKATGMFPAVFPPDIEVRVMEDCQGGRLVAVIELVSEANKDRPDSQGGFAGKLATYLQHGVGVVVVDPVRVRRFNLHDALMDLLDRPEDRMPADTPTYCTAYKPEAGPGGNHVRYWAHRLDIGQPLPTVPLGIKGWGWVPLDLEALYTEACRIGRVK